MTEADTHHWKDSVSAKCSWIGEVEIRYQDRGSQSIASNKPDIFLRSSIRTIQEPDHRYGQCRRF